MAGRSNRSVSIIYARWSIFEHRRVMRSITDLVIVERRISEIRHAISNVYLEESTSALPSYGKKTGQTDKRRIIA
jgi:hypothetical protein